MIVDDPDDAEYHVVDCLLEDCSLCPEVYRDEAEAIETAKVHQDTNDVWVTNITRS